MKILQISSARSIGGGERHVIDLSNELARRGHDVYVAATFESPLPELLTEVPTDNIIELPLRNALDVGSAIKLARFAKEKRIELINAHFARDYPPTAAASRIARVPYVLTRHVLFPMNRLQKVFLRDARFVIAPSKAVADNLRAQALFPPEKIVTIRYGLDITRFPVVERAKGPNVVVGSIGNLDPVKGFDILIEAAARVVKEVPHVRFRIVGEDRSRDRGNEYGLRKLIEKLGLTETVELVGWSDDVRKELAGFDVFVSASRSESFGFVIAEAMLTGIPVIATETEGAKEIISHPELGTLVPIADAERLATAIREALSMPSTPTGQLETARRHISEHFSIERMADETEELFKRASKDF